MLRFFLYDRNISLYIEFVSEGCGQISKDSVDASMNSISGSKPWADGESN